ncbi:hypothetical protein P152DRAFT_453548 [Eremomyces bilateralis CBS 781.70]|uniref:Mitochondrial ATPase complex subunit ATP10 n=1 Tax=Eremomyces bilateralis CBS 781.70 TaxID=1392243 RepID=A0A6G1GGF2_9PEZI|nr:uncharacterized protein P152DRAFT_453548 [Eremomyces bilateralis CBS 781.70]KAF1816940.1 hypothetical protein P152DRAFT_453548 [Eremomyces bilateralis CBS 781.70]
MKRSAQRTLALPWAYRLPGLCRTCQLRAFASAPPPNSTPTSPPKPVYSPPPRIKAWTKQADEDDFVPKILGAPIGQRASPRPLHEQAPIAKLSAQERNLESRQELVKELSKSYFRDRTNTKYHKGKTFLANPQIFKPGPALYFPNIRGTTLDAPKVLSDTTSVLRGKVSVVTIFKSQWAVSQVESFVGKKQNPDVHALLDDPRAQLVEINVETNYARALIQRLFLGNLKGERKREDWKNYFFLREGIPDNLREAIGYINGEVGYVYLVDENCKIRWAASAEAEGDESQYLVKGLKRLLGDVAPASS